MVRFSTCVGNLCYGPWEGTAWFQKIRLSADDFFCKASPTNEIFLALYPAICRDFGEAVLDTPAHKRLIFARCKGHRSLSIKGPRITLRRWFHWAGSMDHHLG